MRNGSFPEESMPATRSVFSPTRPGGVIASFPDVCKTPTPGGPVPIPYPNMAVAGTATKSPSPTEAPTATKSPTATKGPTALRTLTASPTHAKLGSPPVVQHTGASVSMLGSPAPLTAQQLRSRLGMVHAELVTLGGANKTRWHLLVEEYVLTAAALYVALTQR
jgi:hypothetical protein